LAIMQYGSRILFSLLLVGFLATCTAEGGDSDNGAGGSRAGTGGSGSGARGGSSSSGSGGSSSSGSGGSSSESGSSGSDPGTGGSGGSGQASDGGYAAEAGGSPKLGNPREFTSPQGNDHPSFSLVDGDGHAWTVSFDDHAGF
jgi:hypothetical protein